MPGLRRALNGCNSAIQFDAKDVYHLWDGGGHSMAELGRKMDKASWITERVVDAHHIDDVKKMLVDWELYENGWLVVGYSNQHLFYYKCQMGHYHTPPTEFKYLKAKRLQK